MQEVQKLEDRTKNDLPYLVKEEENPKLQSVEQDERIQETKKVEDRTESDTVDSGIEEDNFNPQSVEQDESILETKKVEGEIERDLADLVIGESNYEPQSVEQAKKEELKKAQPFLQPFEVADLIATDMTFGFESERERTAIKNTFLQIMHEAVEAFKLDASQPESGELDNLSTNNNDESQTYVPPNAILALKKQFEESKNIQECRRVLDENQHIMLEHLKSSEALACSKDQQNAQSLKSIFQLFKAILYPNEAIEDLPIYTEELKNLPTPIDENKIGKDFSYAMLESKQFRILLQNSLQSREPSLARILALRYSVVFDDNLATDEEKAEKFLRYLLVEVVPFYKKASSELWKLEEKDLNLQLLQKILQDVLITEDLLKTIPINKNFQLDSTNPEKSPVFTFCVEYIDKQHPISFEIDDFPLNERKIILIHVKQIKFDGLGSMKIYGKDYIPRLIWTTEADTLYLGIYRDSKILGTTYFDDSSRLYENVFIWVEESE